MDDYGRLAEFTLADVTTFGIWDASKFGNISGGGATLAVEDITPAIASFRARAAQLSDVIETPACWMSFGRDPDGNSFTIHQRKADERS